MIVCRVIGIALVLAWPLLSAQGWAQGAWPLDRSTTGLREEQLLDETRTVGVPGCGATRARPERNLRCQGS